MTIASTESSSRVLRVSSASPAMIHIGELVQGDSWEPEVVLLMVTTEARSRDQAHLDCSLDYAK